MDMKSSTPKDHLSLVTFNVLAQCFVKSSWFPYCNSNSLRWKKRSKLLINQINEIQPRPDMICLQECDQYEEFWKPKMELMGYQSLYLKKTGTKKDGVGIFWDFTKLTNYGGENVSLNEAIETIQDEDLKGRIIRDSVGLIALFAFNEFPTRRFLVTTTHLFWDPAQPDVKLAQVNFLIKRIREFQLSENLTDLPVFFTGDFNSLPQSQVYQSILSHGFTSAYGSYDPIHGEPPFTNINGISDQVDEHGKAIPSFVGTLDYIFFDSTKINVETLMQLIDYETATSDGGALPSSKYGSDHLALMAQFSFK